MLYHMYEFQHSLFAPARFAIDVTQQSFSNPLSPLSYMPGAKHISAACDVMEQVTRRYGKPKFGLKETIIDGEIVAIEERNVLEKSFCKLKYFKRDIENNDPKLLVVAPLSGHYATLLRGTVEAMLPDHNVYITDWTDARDVPLFEGKFDLDDYIDYLIEMIEFLGPETHILAVCQPSVPVLAAVSIMSAEKNPSVPASMTLMGGPIDTRNCPTEVNTFSSERSLSWFKQHATHQVPWPNKGCMRIVYPGFLQLSAFLNMNLEDHVAAHRKMFDHLVEGADEDADKHRLFYEEYLSVMDLPAEYYLQTVDVVFQRHLLPKGEMMSHGRPVDTKAITKTALMTVEGELDDISGIGQTKAAHDLCANLPDVMKRHYEQKKVGHYGIFNGRKWRNMIAPKVKEFIREHN
ncbi:Intracellular PHB depolymerase [hydrothermal vent metagenome]|uniref:Intracellular PHB depolymerase n=1 Tax=hydrothermal vent metagenome TaxID=652676 RepID=A0A3B1AAG8_9ZZZZ